MNRFRLVHEQARYNARRAIDEAPDGWIVEVREPKRSTPQNDKLHAMVADLMRQKPEGRDLDMEAWKGMLMNLASKMADNAAPFQGTFQPSLDGEGFTYLAPKTSKLRKGEFISLIEAAYWYGARHGVLWSEREKIAA